MTLTTAFRIHGEWPPSDVFFTLADMIGAPEDYRYDDGADPYRAGACMLAATPGQGLPALVDVAYTPDASPLPSAFAPDDGPPPDELLPEANIEATMDTAIGYRAPDGTGCDRLHARLVAGLARWCDERGLRYAWRDEATGAWHDRVDELALG